MRDKYSQNSTTRISRLHYPTTHHTQQKHLIKHTASKIVTITCPIGPFSGERKRTHDYESLARTSIGRVERYLRYTAQVDSNHWKDQARTDSKIESLVELYSVYYTTWTHNILNVLQWSTLTDRL